MHELATVAALRARVGEWRAAGERIALVPTMGNLHAGHLKLVEVARTHAARVVVSVFVNPTQFDRDDDYAAYPRTLAEDRALLQGHGADALFAPAVAELYPHGMELAAYAEVTHAAQGLEAQHRPGHFRGVATVVLKLFNAAAPDVAVFGQKDYQQLAVVRALARELLLPVEIVGVPTQRAPDGLALSSRNRYLTPQERALAPRLYAALRAAAAAACEPGARLASIEAAQAAVLEGAGFRVDYLRFCNAQLRPPGGEEELVVLAAAWLGRARLIDNLPFRRAVPAA